jgi:hypothetical protein
MPEGRAEHAVEAERRFPITFSPERRDFSIGNRAYVNPHASSHLLVWRNRSTTPSIELTFRTGISTIRVSRATAV